MICTNERDGLPCIRTTPHGEFDQHRNEAGKRWYYGDHMQRGMPLRYIYDHTPLFTLVLDDMRSRQ